MKKLILALSLTAGSLLFCGSASASPSVSLQGVTASPVSASSFLPEISAKGRKGSTRVGGTGKSGKGGKYVGGRK
jgi:hypothetical protein